VARVRETKERHSQFINSGEIIMTKALDIQVDGDHYKKLNIQPVQYIMANNIGYMEGNVIKYVTRWKDKAGITDLEKAKHYIELLIEQEKSKTVTDTEWKVGDMIEALEDVPSFMEKGKCYQILTIDKPSCVIINSNTGRFRTLKSRFKWSSRP